MTHLPPHIQKALELSLTNLVRERRYTRDEINMAVAMLDNLMLNITINCQIHNADVGRLIALVIEMLNIVDKAADLDTAAVTGSPGPSGKN